MTEKRCKFDHLKLEAWYDGELSDSQAESVWEHVERCPVCRDYVAGLQDTRSLLVTQPALEPDPAFAARVISSLPHPTQPHGRTLRRQLAAMAAAAVLTAIVAWVGAALISHLPASQWSTDSLATYTQASEQPPAYSGALARRIYQNEALLSEPWPEEGGPQLRPCSQARSSLAHVNALCRRWDSIQSRVVWALIWAVSLLPVVVALMYALAHSHAIARRLAAILRFWALAVLQHVLFG